MKKRFLTILLALLLGCATLFGVGAYALDGHVFDEAGLFGPEEAQELETRLAETSQELGIYVGVVTADDALGKTSEAYADDFYDYNLLGEEYGQDRPGVIMLINMQSREVHLSTCGEAINMLTDYALENIQDMIGPYLSQGDFHAGALEFMSGVRTHVEDYLYGQSAGEQGGENSVDPGIQSGYEPPVSGGGYSGWYFDSSMMIPLLVGVIAAVIALIAMSRGHKMKHSVPSAATYASAGLALTRREDEFHSTYTTCVALPKDDNSSHGGGGSSTHTSSSGTSHGGSTRGF